MDRNKDTNMTPFLFFVFLPFRWLDTTPSGFEAEGMSRSLLHLLVTRHHFVSQEDKYKIISALPDLRLGCQHVLRHVFMGGWFLAR